MSRSFVLSVCLLLTGIGLPTFVSAGPMGFSPHVFGGYSGEIESITTLVNSVGGLSYQPGDFIYASSHARGTVSALATDEVYFRLELEFTDSDGNLIEFAIDNATVQVGASSLLIAGEGYTVPTTQYSPYYQCTATISGREPGQTQWTYLISDYLQFTTD